jgi:RNA polymerase sigma factor (sigma-70 family)
MLAGHRGWVPEMTLFSATEWSNTRLVKECLRGNEQAWNMLVDRYKNLVYSIPIRYGLPPQDAADIFQAVCLDLFNELSRLRDAEALQGWLMRVTTHKCYHWKRQQSPVNGDFDDAALDGLSGNSPIAADVIADLEREQLVRDSIEQLPPRCRQMITLLFFEHPPQPYNEVAEKLGLARGSIGFIRGRCLKRLKRILQDKGF